MASSSDPKPLPPDTMIDGGIPATMVGDAPKTLVGTGDDKADTSGDKLSALGHLRGSVLSVTVYAVAALYLFFNLPVYPGAPMAWTLSAFALLATGACGMAITVLVALPMTRVTFITSSALLWPIRLAALWLLLQFGLQTPNPGSGTALGVLGLVGLLLPYAFAAQLRRYELVKKFAPELIGVGGHPKFAITALLVARPPQEEHSDHWLRDNAESIIIALIMALVIRTFALEAFQIPTGSMKQTLVGKNDRVVTASHFDTMSDIELIERALELMDKRGGQSAWEQRMQEQLREDQAEGMLRKVNRSQLIDQLAKWTGDGKPDTITVRPGDKILVNKAAYYFGEPKRWDIVVFKYPLNAKRNFIKRLTGLPGEEMVIYRGDVWTRPLNAGRPEGEFELQRKPDDVQQELWAPIYLMKYAGFTNDVREADGTLYGILPLGPTDSSEWTADGEAALQPFPVDSVPVNGEWAGGFVGEWQAWGDWVPTSGRRLPVFFYRNGGSRMDRSNQDSEIKRSPRRVWWFPPDNEEPGAWRIKRKLESLRTAADSDAPPGFFADGGENWETLAYTGDIVDRFELPTSRAVFDKYDDKERNELMSAPGHDRHQVGDIRVRARVRLADASSSLRIVLYNDGERLQLTINGDGTGDLRLLPLRLAADNELLPEDEDALATPDQSLTEWMRQRNVTIEPGVPFRLAFSNADRRARVRINGVPLPSWDYQPLQEQSPEANFLDRLPPESPSTLTLAAKGGRVEVGMLNIDRDIHYFLESESRTPQYEIPEGNFFVMGDNAHNSKDSRLWFVRTMKIQRDDGSVRTIMVEPDPASDSQHKNHAWQLWLEKNLARASADGSIGISLLEDDLARFQSAVRALPKEHQVLLIEDVHGVVQTIDLSKEKIVSMEDQPAHFVRRRALIGRALLRFWPLDESRFIH